MAARVEKLVEAGWISVAQASAITALSESLIRREIANGALRAAKLGRAAYRIRRLDIDRWFEERVITPAESAGGTKPRATPADSYSGPRRLEW
jgi:excisionase family DNA binding protein